MSKEFKRHPKILEIIESEKRYKEKYKKERELREREKYLETHKRKSAGFYDSQEWRELRYKTLSRYGRKCMLCYATEVEMHCDHIRPLIKHWELRLDPENIQVLCKDCNLGKSYKHENDFRGEAW